MIYRNKTKNNWIILTWLVIDRKEWKKNKKIYDKKYGNMGCLWLFS